MAHAQKIQVFVVCVWNLNCHLEFSCCSVYRVLTHYCWCRIIFTSFFCWHFVYGTYFAKVQQSNACRLIPQTHREYHIFMCVNGWVSTQLWMAVTQPQCQQRSPHILTLYFPTFVDTKNLSLYRKILRGISYVCLLITNNIHSLGKLGTCYFISYILHHVELKNM